MMQFRLKIQSIFIASILMMVASSIYGQDDMAQVTQYLMQNLRTSQFIENSRRAFLAKIGRERIFGGRANTTFANDPKFSLKKYLIQKLDDPNSLDDIRTKTETKQLVEREADNALRGFYAAMGQNGYKKNDFVDGVAMIFTHNFAAYTGQKASKQFITEQNTNLRQTLLKDEVFQGWTDKDRQTFIERNGAFAYYAASLRTQSEQTNDPQIAFQARRISEDVFVAVLGHVPNPATLEAIAKGEKINLSDKKPIGKIPNKNGKILRLPGAKTTYVYNSQMDVPTSLSARDANQSPQELRQFLQSFYAEVAKRGGQKNDMAFVGALMLSANYYVLNDGKELTQKQFQGNLNLLTELILSSENLQNSTETQKQLAVESLIIDTVFSFNNFRIAKAALLRGNPNEKFDSGQAISGARVSAKNHLMLIFTTLGEKWEQYYLTPDGFVK